MVEPTAGRAEPSPDPGGQSLRGQLAGHCPAHGVTSSARTEAPKSTLCPGVIVPRSPPHASHPGKRLILGWIVRIQEESLSREGGEVLLDSWPHVRSGLVGVRLGQGRYCLGVKTKTGGSSNIHKNQHYQQTRHSCSESSGSRISVDTPPYLHDCRLHVPTFPNSRLLPSGLKPLLRKRKTAPGFELSAFPGFSQLGSKNTWALSVSLAAIAPAPGPCPRSLGPTPSGGRLAPGASVAGFVVGQGRSSFGDSSNGQSWDTKPFPAGPCCAP